VPKMARRKARKELTASYLHDTQKKLDKSQKAMDVLTSLYVLHNK